MSLIHLAEYSLRKSIKHKTSPISAKLVNNLKQEAVIKQEILDNDMLCRVCTDPADIPITEKIENILIISAIRMVANISITEADCYPKYICKRCLEELKIAFKFKKRCEASDMIFRKTISQENTLATTSQPMVKHDFSLLLHQMEEKRYSQKLIIKQDQYDDTYNTGDAPYSSPSYCNEETSQMPDAINKKPKKRKKRPSAPISTTIQKRIMNLIKDTSDSNDEANDKTITDISKHKNGNRKKPVKIHRCRRCDLKFDSKEDFQKHTKENSCVYHTCPLCSKVVLNLANHQRIVHSRTNKYTCHQCGKIYYSSGALVNHMYKHTDTKEYFCDHCPYKGKRKSYLVCHMKVHTGEHRYLCSMCPSKFTSQSNLSKHQLVHFDKKFECSKCKKLFRQAKQLKEHFDAAHLNIRYRCSICGKDLSSRKKLLSHELRVHKREKHKLFEEVQRVVIENNNDG